MEQFIFSPKSLGIAIKRKRKLLGLNQTETGDRYRLEQATISSIERGAPGTRLETLFRVLAALDLELVVRSKNKKKDETVW